MSDEELVHPPAIGDSAPDQHLPVESAPPLPPQEYEYDAAFPSPYEQDSGGGLDVRRYVSAILRFKWLLVLSAIVAVGASYYVWTSASVAFQAVGTIWIEQRGRDREGDVAPIRPGGLLQSNAWIELLRSFEVLDTVVAQQGLNLIVSTDFAPAFSNFDHGDEFVPGDYELQVGEAGEDVVLMTREGAFVQQALVGAPIGESMGFRWTPARGSLQPGARIRFRVMSIRDAAQDLSEAIDPRIDPQGNFIRLSMLAPEAEHAANVLNAVMERHVDVAHQLTRRQLDETLAILLEQQAAIADSLSAAERALEEFRVNTIMLPSDQPVPIRGGLEVTRGPVFDNYFSQRVQLETFRRDRMRLEAALESFDNGPVRIEALEMIEATDESSELNRVLEELVDVRSELRALRDRYNDDYRPIQDLMERERGLEENSIPMLVGSIITELETREREMQGFVDATADELAEIPPRTIEEGRLRRRVATTENLYNELRGRVESAQLAAASASPDIRILDRAAVPNTPFQDQRVRLIFLIFVGSFGAAIGGAIVLDRFDARFRYASDVARDIGVDILGSIPRIETRGGRRGVINAAQTLEAFRELRIHVGFAYGSAGPITLAITSPSEGEGKSLISSNLAVAFAEVGRRTLLIDGDTRRGNAHRLFGRERTPGLVDYLKARSGDDIIQPTDHANLDFIACGSRGVSTPELLASPRMAYLVGTFKRTYDVIIVDCPPLASGGDPLILGSLTGNLAVVIRTGTTEKGLAQAKLDQLSRLPIRILGAILNDVSPQDSTHSYYASYLPSYEPVAEEGDEDEGTQLLGSMEGSEASASGELP